MYPRGHRGFAAALMLLALVLSAIAFLPATARAQTYQITGLVSQCGSPTTFIAGAKVTLNDANGALPPQTVPSDGAGVFVFTPPSANYTISAAKDGYYSNSTPTNIATPFRFDGSSTISVDLCLDVQPAASNTVTFSVVSGSNPVGGATITIYNPARLPTPWSALIYSNVTNTSTGKSIASLWTGSFEVRVTATGYAPSIQTLSISTSTTITISVVTQNTVVGHAKNASGQFVSAGLVGWLYNLGVPAYDGTKVIRADVSGSLFTFNAPAGNYKMIVDANGYRALEIPLSLPAGAGVHDATLQASAPESYQTTVLFGARDWNNITVYHNLTLNADSSLPGLLPAGLHDLRLQISDTLGNSNGTVGTNEYNSFTAWLLHNGPLYTTTDSFLLLNGRAFNSSVTSYAVSVSTSLLTPKARVWINSTTTYQVKSKAWVYFGQPKYYLNMTLYPDTNVSVYQNQTYIVQLPKTYEMATDTILPATTPPAITTYNFTRITVDPAVVGSGITPQIRMVLARSLNGTARAKVVGPAGDFYVVNSTYQNYQAYVAQNKSLTFSAAESTDPVGDITKANFTWRFESNVSTTQFLGYGISPTFRYKSMGEFVVNLTVVQGGGNVSYRDIKVWVDGTLPVANFRTNLTGSGSAANTNLSVNQGTTVRFDGSLSTDLAYPGKAGVIPNSGYAWDFDGDRITDATGRVVNWTFNKPGKFIVNLTATDGVGWKGANASMTVTVNDTQAPVPAFTILDPTSEYAPVSALLEGRNYTFNASTTTDNYDKVSALNFTWTIPGPIFGEQGNNHTRYGMNITFGWQSWNNSYAVLLSVKDTGFGSHKPNTGNLTRSIRVGIDWSRHPDLYIVVGTPKVDNANPDSGATITITLNVTNKPNRGAASQISVAVSEGTGSQATSLAPTWRMFDKNGNPVSPEVIASGATVTLRISVTVVGQGNKTLNVFVVDQNEPYTVRTSENAAKLNIVVNQPAWVNIAIVGAIVGVFLVVIGAMYYRRKVKAGDWQPVRLRREKGGKDEGGKERPRKEKEAKEEKKRL